MESILSPRRLLKATKVGYRKWEVRNSGNFRLTLQNIRRDQVSEALKRLEAQR